MRHHRIGRIANVTHLLLLVAATACSSSGGSSESSSTAGTSPDGGATKVVPPPPPVSTHPPCVISADCPSGQYCDLEECVQECSTKVPCSGDLTCDPRGRCIPPGTTDKDPTPTGQSQGALTVTPTNVLLLGQAHSLVVTLRSTGSQPVRYRIAVSGAHLSVAQPSGQFSGSTNITIAVDPSKVVGQDADGTVSIYTSLGDAVVDAPIHAGVTGFYKGKMQYDGGPVSLGDTQVSLDLIESSGGVQARVDSADSLLFPSTTNGDATGHGAFNTSNGVDATVAQVYPALFGGAANPFKRDVGRSVRFQVKPDTLGGLDGTFQETIVGLFAEPITTTGHVSLSYVPSAGVPSFSVAAAPQMPPSPSSKATVDSQSVLGFSTGGCAGIGIWIGTSNQTDYALPLQTAFNAQTSSNPAQPFFENIASSCVQALKAPDLATWNNTPLAQPCGLPAGVACQLQWDVLSHPPSDPTWGPQVGALTAQTLRAPLLVAKNEIVGAITDSFTDGLSQELAHYTNAMSALQPYATWSVQPALLEFLRSMPATVAQGPAATSTQSQDQTYPSVRALSDVFYTMALVEREQARINAASASASKNGAVGAQEQALLTYLEAATVSEILKQWGTAPSAVKAQFTGVLTPLDQGFSALAEGGNVFGVPDGYVPFVYRPSDSGKGATNFEQMLSIASNAVANEQAVETQFLADERAYDTAVSQLQQELSNVKVQYDERIAADCGTDFDIDAITGDDDPGWSNCGGPNQEGAVGQAVLTVQLANAALASAQSRIQGQKQKIQIDVNAQAQIQGIQSDTLSFISSTGQAIAATDFASGLVDAAIQTIQVASNASIDNLGAPLAEAAGVAVLGVMKAALTQQRDQLQTAQTMGIQMGQDQQQNVTAMANIQKEEIDLAQAVVDIDQQEIAAVQAQLQARDKLDEAKQIWEDRARQLAVIAQDPTHDPSYRLLADALSIQVVSARATAQQQLYLATSALEYEINTSIADAVGPAMNATNATNLGELQSCLLGIYNNSRVAYGSPQDYITTISVRQMLGITGPRKDPVTGVTLSEGDQFRQLLLKKWDPLESTCRHASLSIL